MFKKPSISEVTLRRAENRDFLAVAALDRKSWGNDPQSQFIPDGEHAWRIWVEYAYVIVAEFDEEIIGAILAFPTHAKHEVLYAVHKLFVHSEHQNKGLGTRLFDALLDILDNEENAASFLTVRPDNQAAIQLYHKMGYQFEKHIDGYYRANEPRLLMKRTGKG